MIDWQKLIDERNEWVAHNFPDTPSTDSIIGVIEELGELAHAHLKKKTNIRTNEDHIATGKDAIGDLIIYLLGVMNQHNIQPTTDFEPPLTNNRTQDTERALFELSYRVGGLAHTGFGGYVSTGQVDYIIYYARAYCISRYWTFDDIVNQTWDQVKQRDWQKNAEDGSISFPVDDAGIPK